MDKRLRSWLETSLSARTFVPAEDKERLGPAFLKEVMLGVYPGLLHSGLPILPNVALDFAALFREGEAARFRKPALRENLQRASAPYVQFLEGVYGQSFLHRTAFRCANRRERGAQVDANALAGFLKIAAQFFPLKWAPDTWGQLDKEWDTAQVWAAVERQNERTDNTALGMLGAFWEGFGRTAQSLAVARGKAEKAYELLILAGAHLPNGAHALNLPLLQACFDYSPLGDSDDETRSRQAATRLTPKESSSSRSPELGNFGITKEGSLSTLLRTELARPDFESRWWRNELFFYQRYAKRMMRRRVLVAWVIDRGEAMSVRDRHQGDLSTAALRFAAYAAEDVARRLAGNPAVELRFTILMHNGEPADKLRSQFFTIDESDLDLAPQLIGQPEMVWFPGLPSVFPHFFLREPVWPDATPKAVMGTPSAAQRAVALLHRRTEMEMSEPDSDDYDLVYVTICAPDASSRPSTGEERLEVPRWTGFQSRSVLNLLAYSKDVVRSATLPPVRKSSKGIQGDYSVSDTAALRRAHWEGLWEMLLSIQR